MQTTKEEEEEEEEEEDEASSSSQNIYTFYIHLTARTNHSRERMLNENAFMNLVALGK